MREESIVKDYIYMNICLSFNKTYLLFNSTFYLGVFVNSSLLLINH